MVAPAPPLAEAGLLDALSARPRTDAALSRDGVTWLTVGELLDRAHRLTRSSHPTGVVVVPADDPVTAVVHLLAALGSGQVPVVGGDAADPRVLSLAAGLAPRARSGPEAPLVLVTSGTSGRPRAVVRTVASWQRSLPGYDALLGPLAPGGSVGWAPGAPAATLTLFALWHALAVGRPVIAPGPWRAGAGTAAGATAESVQCVPPILADLLAAREAGALPTLRRAVVAGAAVPASLRARAAAAGLSLAEYYGAAELSFVAADPDGDGLRAFPGAEVAVRDDEVWVRSPYVALGYLDHEPAGALRTDDDGWATVGDRGSLSPSGVLRVRGRGDGTATVGGTTVTLADVEAALGTVDQVAEIVALPVPDARFGERVVAVVRPAGGPTGAAADPDAAHELVSRLRAAARAQLTSAARPVRYLVRDRLPRLPGGKVARSALLAEVSAPGPRTLGS